MVHETLINNQEQDTQENPINPKVNGVMTWVRLLLPMGLAALGWYIGQTVGNLNERLTAMEADGQIIREQFLEHRAADNAWMREMERRLAADELTISDMVSMDQFRARVESHERRMERIEDRLHVKE